MLDYFAIFTRGGALLWTLQFTALRHSPLDALNALIRTCLLEERSSDNTFTYVPKTGAHQALKWTFNNGLGLVFVAVYQKSLSLLYVDELLALVKAEFSALYQSSVSDYKSFGPRFEKLLRDCEARADLAKKGQAPKRPVVQQQASKGAAGTGSSKAGGRSGAAQDKQADGDDGDAEDSGDDGRAAAGGAAGTQQGGVQGGSDDGSEGAANGEAENSTAFNISKLKGGPRGAKGRPGAAPVVKKPEVKEKKEEPVKKGKVARVWGAKKGTDPNQRLDFSDGTPPPDYGADYTGGSATDGTAGRASEPGGGWTDVGASDSDAAVRGISRMDEDDVEDETDEELERLVASGSSAAAAPSKGVLGSFLGRLALRVVGSGSLTAEDLRPALEDMKRRLMERNVAEEIAASVCASVGRSLEGRQLASFTGVGAMVRRSFEEALSGILHKRQVDVLLDIKAAQQRGRPYVIVFCGVNGVGKSTNLAKIAYWLGQNGIKVTIAACDTFRAGAVEQLKTHCARLKVPLYERGYEKDPAKVAAEAVKMAEREGRDVVLVDTAGRMQDNEPLMRALSNLIAVNDPQLVLFVGEALVGNDAVDQLTKFNRALQELAPAALAGVGGAASAAAASRAASRRGIDGIVLTKFDTIDDKVGAALSMVYSSGAPIMFVGCGQTYQDLKKLNVKSVVNSLLK